MGTDVNASFSGSSSATSGVRTDSSYRYGDVIIGTGGGKPQPPWLQLAIAGMLLAGVVVLGAWFIRR
jgi:hypothetical protein